ncbi:hypothetical protein N9C39_01090 [Luminiphilus sp.]|nr:hypothetical protein [Luminiphilus sp.]
MSEREVDRNFDTTRFKKAVDKRLGCPDRNGSGGVTEEIDQQKL